MKSEVVVNGQHVLGCAVIESPPCGFVDALAPAITPTHVVRRALDERLTVLADGRVVTDERDLEGATAIGNAFEQPIDELWPALRQARDEADDASLGFLLP